MAFTRPTLSELKERIETDLASRLVGSAKVLRRAIIKVLAIVIAGVAHLVYGYIDWAFKQIFPDQAEEKQLKRWAAIWDVARNAATFAEGPVVFVSTAGTIISAGALLQRADGVQYTVDADGESDGGETEVDVTCITAGEDGNMDAGESLSLVTPIAGVTSDGTVDTGGLVGGNDEEDIEDWRVRVLEKIAEPPSGGTASDYERWAKEVTGVTRVWVYENLYGAGTVGVAFVRDDDSPSIIPSVGEVADVQEAIDLNRPLTAEVTVWAPVANELDFEIQLTPDTAAIRTAVEAEIEDLLKRVAEPGGTIYLSQISEAISAAVDEDHHALVVPASNQTAPAGEIFVKGTITFS